MNNLILFTNRSGSTVLCDLLAYANDTVNLGEGLHSLVRDYNYNSEKNKDTYLYKAFKSYNITSSHHNAVTRGSNHIEFFKDKQRRIDMLRKTPLQWTVKENTEKQLMDINFIDYCCKSKFVNVYMTHRANIIDQFVSFINARYRAEIARHKGSHFIFTNNDEYQSYDNMSIQFNWLHMYTNVFIEQLMMWRLIYDKFKPHVRVVSYESHTKPMNFEHIGISKDVVEKYKQETNHLIPTPHNVRKVTLVDDHPKHMVGAWEQSLYYVEKFKHLVEI